MVFYYWGGVYIMAVDETNQSDAEDFLRVMNPTYVGG